MKNCRVQELIEDFGFARSAPYESVNESNHNLFSHVILKTVCNEGCLSL